VTERDLTEHPDLLTTGPVRSEVLRLAFGWTDTESTAAPAIPPKIDPEHVDWADRFVRPAALDAMADPELDMLSGTIGDWEVTVGGGDDDSCSPPTVPWASSTRWATPRTTARST